MILLDTSGILSALFPDQYRHKDCARILLESDPPLILSPFVLAETDYLIHKYGGVATEALFLEDVARGAYELPDFRAADVDQARQLVTKYASLRIGLTDASIAVLAARYETLDLLTLDERHFRAIRPMPRKNFRILPADA
ncbi:MAG TPA: PIN domain-containing protein [Thermoanaerobaculia bacterium]|nr:PIN domain-containing protein [Thermoanaerobaculia bacterium]